MLPRWRAAELVAGQQHRHALRQEQRRQQIADLPLAQLDHLRIVGRSFDAAVPAQVVVVTVAVVFEIRFVVLLVRTQWRRTA